MAYNVEDLIQAIRQLSPSDREELLDTLLEYLRTESKVHDITDLESQFPNEWLAILLPENEDRYNPMRGHLIAHGPDKSVVWKQVGDLSTSDDVYVFFNGPIVSKGFGITFHDTTDTPVVATVGD